jgi:cell division protein FtsB
VPGREDGRAEDATRARPAGSGGQQRRPSTARRPARSGRRAVGRTIRMHGLLGLSSTRRAAVLALVVCALVLSVAVPLRNYLAQRGTLQDTVQQQDTLRRQVDELERRRTQLLDPTQVEVEARERLRYVRPGETPYVVQLPTPTPEPVPTDAPRSAGDDQWYGQLWRSIADQETGQETDQEGGDG